MRKCILLILVMALLSLMVITAPDVCAEELFRDDFGGVPYEGMNHLVGPGGQPYIADKAYGKNLILETVIQVHDIGSGDGRGVKFILREHLLATSGDMELWIGKTGIWACTTEWKNLQDFDFSPFLGRDVAVKIVAFDSTLVLFLDDVPVWSCTDVSFALTFETPVEMGGWDAAYTIKSFKLSTATEEDLKTETEYKDYVFPIPEMGGTTYYVDANAGENGDGLTPETAWKTIEQVNAHSGFLPDDRLLFKRGCVWEGTTLKPQGSGVEGHPITLGSYGEGEKPIIDRKSVFDPSTGQNGSYAVRFENQQYWIVENIEIRNNSATTPGKPEEPYRSGTTVTLPMRGGILFTGTTTPLVNKRLNGLVLRNVTVSQVDCIAADEGIRLQEIYEGVEAIYGGAGGIAIRGSGNPLDHNGRITWDNVLIVDCEFRDVGGVPISVEGGWNYTDTVTNLVIRNNYIYNTDGHQMTGHGIYIVNAKEPLVEYNRIQNTSNGIAMQVCNGGTMQYNVVTGTDGYMHYASELSGEDKRADGCAYDVETDCEGTFLLQNNFSANCYSDAYVAFDYNNRVDSPSARNAHVIIRNNISVNDKLFFHYPASNRLYRLEVTNNTVIRTEDALYGDQYETVNVLPNAAEGAVTFTHNVFCYAGNRVTLSSGPYAVFEDNLYDGDIFLFFPDEKAVTGDPAFVSIPTAQEITDWNASYCGNIPGTGDLSQSGFFRLYANSPCIVNDRQVYGADLNEFFGGVTAFGKEAPVIEPVSVDGKEPEKKAPEIPAAGIAVVAAALLVGVSAVVAAAMCKKKPQNGTDTPS